MQTLVIYDVVDTSLRNRVIDVLEDYGLARIQYSAFLGDLNFNRREEMCQRLEDTIAEAAARVHVVTLCDRDYRLIRELIGRLSWQMEVTSRTLAPRRAAAGRAEGTRARSARRATSEDADGTDAAASQEGAEVDPASPGSADENP